MAAPTGQLVPRTPSVPPACAVPPLSVGGSGVGVRCGVGEGVGKGVGGRVGRVGSGVGGAVGMNVGTTVGVEVGGSVGAVVGTTCVGNGLAVTAGSVAVARGGGVTVMLVPAVNPRPGSGEKSDPNPVFVGLAGCGSETGTTFTGSCAMTTSGPRPFANSAPFGPTPTSIFDSNFLPGSPLPFAR